MAGVSLYSLKVERLSAERQQAVIRIMLSLMTIMVLGKFYYDQFEPGGAVILQGRTVAMLVAVLMSYSIGMWALVRWRPDTLRIVQAAGSVLELGLIALLIRTTASCGIPFYLWYIFYVVSVATRYGGHYSILALSASVVSFTMIILLTPQAYTVNVPAVLGFTGFLLVLAYMFGQMSERQLRYQASLAVVTELRGELASLATSKDIIEHLLERTKRLIGVEHTFFLPAARGADHSEEPGLRSAGAEPTLMSAFREGGGPWNVEEILLAQNPVMSNNISRHAQLPGNIVEKLRITNMAAAPMMVRGLPVGVIYAANHMERPLVKHDLQLLDLVANQSAPSVENALLWERLREAAASEERLRIARDLHDNFLQTLAAIKLYLERCKILVQKDPNRALDNIDRIHEVATHGLAEARAYLAELRQMGPEPSRFSQAVEKCSAEVAAKAGFEAKVDVKKLEESNIPPNVALAAFQVLRELLNNAAQHSKAGNVQVRVRSEDGNLIMEVEDDGSGFDVPKVRAQKAAEGHLGLVGVEERIRQLNGTFELKSAPGEGTKAVVSLSL